MFHEYIVAYEGLDGYWFYTVLPYVPNRHEYYQYEGKYEFVGKKRTITVFSDDDLSRHDALRIAKDYATLGIRNIFDGL